MSIGSTTDPTWLWGSILVGGCTIAACCGLLLFHRLVHVKLRRAHNDLAGFTIAVIGVLYAVLLAFIAIATWESFSKASDIVEAESDYAGGIYLDTQGLPDAKGKGNPRCCSPLRQCRHRRGMADPAGWQGTRPGMEAAGELDSAIATIQPQNLGEAVIEAELLETWNELYQARRQPPLRCRRAYPSVIVDRFFGVVFLLSRAFRRARRALLSSQMVIIGFRLISVSSRIFADSSAIRMLHAPAMRPSGLRNSAIHPPNRDCSSR